MGNAGIIRELLRYARLSEGGAAGYAVPWPDHPVTGDARPAASPTAWPRAIRTCVSVAGARRGMSGLPFAGRAS